MNAMIPHHSIAILTSELADGIAATQRKEIKEIKEMDWLVHDIEENGPATTSADAEERPVPDFGGSAGATVDRALWRAMGVLTARPVALL